MLIKHEKKNNTQEIGYSRAAGLFCRFQPYPHFVSTTSTANFLVASQKPINHVMNSYPCRGLFKKTNEF